jgi:hypothetical protein
MIMMQSGSRWSAWRNRICVGWSQANSVRIELMRILLQHVRTQLYLRNPDDWTANPFESFDFQHSQRAIEFAREHNLSGVQIVVTFVDSQFDEIVPMPSFLLAPHRPSI